MAKKIAISRDRFVEEYCSNGFNATQAAIKAGYSKATAASQGQRLLKNVEISSQINQRLDELSLKAEELIKLQTDIARGNLANYMTVRKIEHTPTVEKHLSAIIKDLEYQLLLKEEFCAEKGYTEEEYDKFQESLEPIRDKILRYRIELRHNPMATRFVPGETELVDHIEVDMAKLIADKERGIIKSFKHGKNGLEVELYPADAAMDKLMRVRGMYKDNLKLEGEMNLNTTLHEKVSPERAKELLEQFSKGNFNE